jgi:hypothetical protein
MTIQNGGRTKTLPFHTEFRKVVICFENRNDNMATARNDLDDEIDETLQVASFHLQSY